MDKTIPECGHALKWYCTYNATFLNQNMCEQPCESLLSCGHPCRRPCCDVCLEADDCRQLVEISSSNGLCGHLIRKPCNESAGNKKFNNRKDILLMCYQEIL